MLEIFEPYLLTIWCLLAAGGLLLTQLLVADVVGLTNSHTPGSAVTADHNSFHFRATRAHANTNESIAAFLLLSLSCVALGAVPNWVNWLALAYCVSRMGHMLCYWVGWQTARSLFFMVSLAALFGFFALGVVASSQTF